MQLIEVVLKHFGKFREKKLVFSEGINLIYGENEAGKSTIYSGIKGILFGMERGRGKAAKTDQFSKYEPWEDSNYYAGALRFLCEDKLFCVDRKFDKYGKDVRLFCENDGEEFSADEGDLTMLLDGLTMSDFEETVAVGQMKVETGATLAAALKDYAANYFSTGNSEINLSKALQILKERKKEVDKETRELNRKKQEKRDQLELEMSYIWKDIHTIESEREKWTEELAAATVRKEKWEELQQKEAGGKKALRGARKWRVHPLAVFGMFAATLLIFLFVPKPLNGPLAAVLLVAEVLFIWNRIKDGKRKKAAEKEAEHGELTAQIDKIQWQLARIEEDYQEKRTLHSNLREEIAELDEVSDEVKAQNKRREALELAELVMLQSSKDMQKRLEGRLNERLSEILSVLTDGKYDQVWVDDDLRIRLYSEGRKVELEQVSRGTVEQIYFALRMAAIEILHKEEFPVILDDTFAYYDEKRVEAALKWLAQNRRQVLIFTCHKREEELLRKNGIAYHKIVL